MNGTKVQVEDGLETVYVHEATVSSLARFLDPEVPWVWLFGHRPVRAMRWWEADLPVNAERTRLKAEYRDIAYDMMLPTRDFMKAVLDFDDHGIALIQSRNRMPDTLDIARLPRQQQGAVLRQNGAFLGIYLPHAVETAQVQCFQNGYLGRKLEGMYLS